MTHEPGPREERRRYGWPGTALPTIAYAVPNHLVDWHLLDVAIPVGHWRAPYANSNTFAMESFIDVLAHAAGQDPLAVRLAHLAPGSRPRNVLERAAKLAGWNTPAPAGRARGLAMAAWGDGWIATVAEVSLPGGKLKVHKMTASVDVGQPINIDGLEQQIPSAMIYTRSRPRSAGRSRSPTAAPSRRTSTTSPCCTCPTRRSSWSISCAVRRSRPVPARSERPASHRRWPTRSSPSTAGAYARCR